LGDFYQNLPFTSSFIEVNGSKIHYFDEGPKDSTISIFLVHGNPTSSFTFRNLIKLFSETYRTIAIDLPGFGRSVNNKPIDNITPTDFINIVINFVKAINLQNILLIGHEWGATLAVGAAIQDNQRYQRIVVLNSITNPITKFPVSYKLSMKSANDVFKKKIVKGSVKGLSEEDFENYTKIFAAIDQKLILILEKSIPTSKEDVYYPLILNILSKFESWDIPTKIIFGNQDRMFTEKNATELSLKLARTNLHIIENAGHLVHEDKLEEVYDIIRQWIS
jgi:pimeloyl-ACP methyl ester carboxylesterase